MKKLLLLALAVTPLAVSRGANVVYRNAVLANNPVAYYEFDETSGTTAADTAASFDGTYTGAMGLGSASGAPNLGTAADFAGGWVDLDFPTLGTFDQSSIELWIQPDSVAGGCCTAIITTDGWDVGRVHFNLIGGNVVEHAVNSDPAVVHTSSGLASATWYHLVVTNDITVGETKYYLNGSLVGDDGDHPILPGGVSNVFGVTGLQIGAWDGTRIFDGRMDEFAIYDSVLTASDVSNHFAAATIPEPSAALLLLVGVASAAVRRRR